MCTSVWTCVTGVLHPNYSEFSPSYTMFPGSTITRIAARNFEPAHRGILIIGLVWDLVLISIMAAASTAYNKTAASCSVQPSNHVIFGPMSVLRRSQKVSGGLRTMKQWFGVWKFMQNHKHMNCSSVLFLHKSCHFCISAFFLVGVYSRFKARVMFPRSRLEVFEAACRSFSQPPAHVSHAVLWEAAA